MGAGPKVGSATSKCNLTWVGASLQRGRSGPTPQRTERQGTRSSYPQLRSSEGSWHQPCSPLAQAWNQHKETFNVKLWYYPCVGL